jgi:hypothetical protein
MFPNARNVKYNLSLILIAFSLLLSCSSDDDTETIVPEYHAPIFDLTDAKAVVYFGTGNTTANGRTSESGPGNLFKLNAAGERSPACWGASFAAVRPLRKGLFVTHYNDASKNYVYHVVELDNSSFQLDGYGADLIGENDAGDLIFADGHVFRRATKTVETLNTNLPVFMVASVSGNFATVRAGADFYVMNTVTGKQYPVQNCHGPLIAALDTDQVFIDDCQAENLLTFTTGDRSTPGILPFGFSARTAIGIATLDSKLTEYNTQGQVTFEAPYPIASRVLSFTNSGDYFIIHERTGVSVMKRGNPEVRTILSEVNVSRFSAANGILYYAAVQKNGRPVVGVVDLESDEDTVVPGNAPPWVALYAFE